MKINNLILSVLLTTGLLGGCKSKKQQSEGQEITVDIKRGQYINMSSFCSDISYIPLGLGSENLIGSINKIVKVKDMLYLFDEKTLAIHKYDIMGNFISKFNRIGKGPGECAEISDFVVDTTSNQVYILDVGNPKILITDKDWNTISERKKPGYFGKFEIIAPDTFIYYASNYFNPDLFTAKQSYNLLISDSVNTHIKMYLPIIHTNFHSSEYNQMVPVRGGILVSPPLENKIFFANKDECTLKYKINFKEYNPSRKFRQFFDFDEEDSKASFNAFMATLDEINSTPYAIYINNMYETPTTLYFRFFLSADKAYSNNGIYTVVHNSVSKTTLVGIPNNDLDYGVFGTPLSMINDTLYTVFYPHLLRNRIKQLSKQSKSNPNIENHIKKLKQLAGEKNEEQNPILARIVFKKIW